MRELGGSLVSLGCNYWLFLKTKYVVSKIFKFMSVDQKLGPYETHGVQIVLN